MRHAIGIWILVFVALYVAGGLIRIAYPRLSWTRERRARRLHAQMGMAQATRGVATAVTKFTPSSFEQRRGSTK